MKLALASADRILLELTAWELQRYGLLAATESGYGETVRQKLERLLSDLAQTTGRRYRLQQSARVDFLPDRYGGCLLIVSGLEKRAMPSGGHCFAAQSENDLIDAARAACATHCGTTEVTLLQSDHHYYLLTPPLNARIRTLLSEYMHELPLSASVRETLKEQCTVLLDNQPLSALCGGA